MRYLFCCLLLSTWSAGPLLPAQTNAALKLQLYAGLTVSGTVGSNYLIQYTTNFSSGTNWQTLTNLTLTSSPYLLIDTNVPAIAQRFYRIQPPVFVPPPFVPAGMALIAGGSFVMGDSIDGESDAPVGSVAISAFFMDTNLVNSALWKQVSQWASTNGYLFDNTSAALGPNYPAQTVNWFDVVKWCNARSQQAGQTAVYYTDTNLTQIYKTGDTTPYPNWKAMGYRLPTEAEWEKAARGGLPGLRFPWGNSIAESQANYYGNPYNAGTGTGYGYDQGPAGNNAVWYTNNTLFTSYLGNTSVVGYFAPNGYGINDVAGNVFEWCWDWYGAYGTYPLTDPHGPTSGTTHVTRGGGWNHFANECRSAFRSSEAANFADDEHGFRTVLPQNP